MAKDTRFKPGNPGGPGRPRRATEQQYLSSMAAVVTIEDWQAITSRAVQDAKAGDNAARTWLSRHLVGDEPLLLNELMEQVAELKATLEGSKHVNGNVTQGRAAGRGSVAGKGPPDEPGVDRPGIRPFRDDDDGGDDAGQVAGDDPPLFE
jgi:hypothetical protein